MPHSFLHDAGCVWAIFLLGWVVYWFLAVALPVLRRKRAVIVTLTKELEDATQ